MTTLASATQTTIKREDLPDDVEALKDLVLELHQKFESLLAQVAAMRRAMYGPRSERLAEQPELFDETVEVEVPPEHTETLTYDRRRRNGRPALPANLPRQRREYDLSDEEKSQFARVVPIGEQTSETLEYTPARLTVIEHVRLTYHCESAEGEATVRTAHAEPSPLPKSNAGASLLANVLVSKYGDHIPLHRQERIYARHGAPISRQTLCDWTLNSAELLTVLMPPLVQHVRSGPVIFTDDTTLPLLERGRGKSITARLWVYVAGGERRTQDGGWQRVAPAALYEFTEERRGAHAARWLAGWSGYLQADDFSGYSRLWEKGNIKHAACWMHARRPFYEIDRSQKTPGLARQALLFIRELYKIEETIRDKPPDERQAVRQEHMRPLLDEFHRWLEGHYPKLLPQGPLAKAMYYSLSNWTALTRFVDDGILMPDNGAAERAMRPVAMGRSLCTS
jgi:transposase